MYTPLKPRQGKKEVNENVLKGAGYGDIDLVTGSDRSAVELEEPKTAGQKIGVPVITPVRSAFSEAV